MKKDGYWSGWSGYRYGDQRRTISLAGSKPTPIHNKDKRRHVVSRVMDMMRDWRLSPFENEGPARAGLRSAMCLKGHDWQRSDSEAAALVAEALRLLGAQRPSWDQGQREYVVPSENCNWCAMPLPAEMVEGTRKGRFCSATCARSAMTHRDFETRWKESDIGRSAYSIIMRGSLPEKACEHCHKMFQPFSRETKGQRYCSHACARLALRTIPEKDCPTCGKLFRPRMAGRSYCSYQCAMERPLEERPCMVCKRSFMPKNEQAMYCSKSCTMRGHRMRQAQADGRTHRIAGTVMRKTCVVCRDEFDTLSPKAQYCSSNCTNLANNFLRGRIPRTITPPVFDYVFRMAA